MEDMIEILHTTIRFFTKGQLDKMSVQSLFLSEGYIYEFESSGYGNASISTDVEKKECSTKTIIDQIAKHIRIISITAEGLRKEPGYTFFTNNPDYRDGKDLVMHIAKPSIDGQNSILHLRMITLLSAQERAALQEKIDMVLIEEIFEKLFQSRDNPILIEAYDNVIELPANY